MYYRPTAVTVVAIIAICLASLGMLGYAFTILMTLFQTHTMGGPALYRDPVYIGMQMTLSVVGLLLRGWCLASGIGALRVARWARKSFVLYGIVAILETTAATSWALLYVVPRMAFVTPGARSPITSALPVIMYASAIGGLLFSLILPATILIVFTRPKVVDAFENPMAVPPTSASAFPVQY